VSFSKILQTLHELIACIAHGALLRLPNASAALALHASPGARATAQNALAEQLRSVYLPSMVSSAPRSQPMLIGQYDSPFVRRVAIALTRYAIAYEHVPWSVWADADAIARYNPLRRVPTLVLEDDSVLVESFSILDYLDERVGPTRALLPRTGVVRRDGLRVASLATGVADKAVSLLYEHVLRDGAKRSELWAVRCSTQITQTLALLESDLTLRATPYWSGSELSHSDIAVACALRFLREAHPELAQSATGPTLLSHAARCEALDEFQRVCQPLTF
jgi:glutathione S-transferase